MALQSTDRFTHKISPDRRLSRRARMTRRVSLGCASVLTWIAVLGWRSLALVMTRRCPDELANQLSRASALYGHQWTYQVDCPDEPTTYKRAVGEWVC